MNDQSPVAVATRDSSRGACIAGNKIAIKMPSPTAQTSSKHTQAAVLELAPSKLKRPKDMVKIANQNRKCKTILNDMKREYVEKA